VVPASPTFGGGTDVVEGDHWSANSTPFAFPGMLRVP
jgi:hypothetical protein